VHLVKKRVAHSQRSSVVVTSYHSRQVRGFWSSLHRTATSRESNLEVRERGSSRAAEGVVPQHGERKKKVASAAGEEEYSWGREKGDEEVFNLVFGEGNKVTRWGRAPKQRERRCVKKRSCRSGAHQWHRTLWREERQLGPVS